jgi:hypothetical protein
MLRKSRPLSPNSRASSSSSSCSSDNRPLSVGFHYDDLERFLCFSIALFCNDAELAASAMEAATGLSSRWQEKGIESFPADVANVAMILDAFITMTSRSHNNNSNNDRNNQNSRNDNNSRTCYSSNTNNSRPLPANVVYEVHSFMGLLNMAQKNDAAAKVSFMKALWITAAMSTNNKDDGVTTTSHKNNSKGGSACGGYELALTLHRLGKIYARSSSKSSSNYTEAKNLLSKALEQYEKKSTAQQLSNKDCHALVLDVKNELEQLERQQQQQRKRRSRQEEEASESVSFSLRSRAFQSLPFILEEKTSSSSLQAAAAERRRYSSAN